MIPAFVRRGQRWSVLRCNSESSSALVPLRTCDTRRGPRPRRAVGSSSTTSILAVTTSDIYHDRRIEPSVKSKPHCHLHGSRIPSTSRSEVHPAWSIVNTWSRHAVSRAAPYCPSHVNSRHAIGHIIENRNYHQSSVAPAQEKETPVATEGSEPPSSSGEDEGAAGVVAGAAAAAKKEYSYPELTADAARHKAGLSDPDVPSWQNPLHHHNQDMERAFPEDFATPDEFEAAVLPAPPLSTPDNPTAAPSHVLELAEEIVQLSMLEMSELVNKIADHYGFHEGMLSPDGTGIGEGSGTGLDGDGDADGSSEAAAAESVKTSWDIKLVSFQDSAKIKVIKEVRSLAGLGLKEAKELVEGAPKVVLKQVKTEDAEAIKAKLEELGATIELS